MSNGKLFISKFANCDMLYKSTFTTVAKSKHDKFGKERNYPNRDFQTFPVQETPSTSQC